MLGYFLVNLIILKSLIKYWQKQLETKNVINKVDLGLINKLSVKTGKKIHTGKNFVLLFFIFYSVQFLNFNFQLD